MSLTVLEVIQSPYSCSLLSSAGAVSSAAASSAGLGSVLTALEYMTSAALRRTMSWVISVSSIISFIFSASSP